MRDALVLSHLGVRRTRFVTAPARQERRKSRQRLFVVRREHPRLVNEVEGGAFFRAARRARSARPHRAARIVLFHAAGAIVAAHVVAPIQALIDHGLRRHGRPRWARGHFGRWSAAGGEWDVLRRVGRRADFLLDAHTGLLDAVAGHVTVPAALAVWLSGLGGRAVVAPPHGSSVPDWEATLGRAGGCRRTTVANLIR